MTDWADGIETRNYGIKCKTNGAMLMELMYTIAAFAIVAGALLFYSWIRSEIINTADESQELFAAQESLLQIRDALILEEETLRNPARIDAIARNNLGMTPLRPSQWTIRRAPETVEETPGALAMANSGTTNSKGTVSIPASGIVPIH